jgi:putative MATE family efflux protein
LALFLRKGRVVNMNQTYMKEQKILPLLLKMSLPMVISMMVNSLYNIVDSFFVAKISENAMTALSLVFPVQNLISSVMIGFAIGINAVISFFMGAQNQKQADKAASQGMLLSCIHAVVLTVICIAGMPVFLKMFTKDAEIVSLGLKYSNIAFAFSIMLGIELMFEKVFQAVGRMNASMVCLMTGCIVNIVLDPMMIFGIGSFPAMGIEGAALATGIGQTSAAVLYIIIYIVKPIPVKFRKSEMRIEGSMAKRLYSIGMPASLSLALPSILISVLNVILAAYSAVYVFVLGVYYKLQTFLYLPANGVVQGMRPLMGYNYGAGEHERVRKIYKTSMVLIFAIMAAGTILCLAIPGSLIGLFTSNPDTINEGETALRIISAGFIVSTVSVTSAGALEGLGKGFPSLIISVCRYVVVIIPVAFVMSRITGAVGVWHAFWITEVISSVISYIVYKKNVK